jgi:hypothetical protein
MGSAETVPDWVISLQISRKCIPCMLQWYPCTNDFLKKLGIGSLPAEIQENVVLEDILYVLAVIIFPSLQYCSLTQLRVLKENT